MRRGAHTIGSPIRRILGRISGATSSRTRSTGRRIGVIASSLGGAGSRALGGSGGLGAQVLSSGGDAGSNALGDGRDSGCDVLEAGSGGVRCGGLGWPVDGLFDDARGAAFGGVELGADGTILVEWTAETLGSAAERSVGCGI